MAELLTVKQLQELLQVDRVTIYRMLKDGRLKGIKVGGQWRFRSEDVEEWLRSGGDLSAQGGLRREGRAADILPLHCVQVIQDVFAEIAGIGSVTTGTDGVPVTEMSNVQPFCKVILDSPEGYRGCLASWAKLAQMDIEPSEFVLCHAGLEYTRSEIRVDDREIAILVGGQFYSGPPDEREENERLERLARDFAIDLEELRAAARQIPVLEPRLRARIGDWLRRVAVTFCEVSQERLELISRLRSIAEITSLEGGADDT